MDPVEIRRWIDNQRAAADRERKELRENPLSAQNAFASAMALLNFDEEQNGPPFQRHDPVSEREDSVMQESWMKLRERWRP